MNALGVFSIFTRRIASFWSGFFSPPRQGAIEPMELSGKPGRKAGEVSSGLALADQPVEPPPPAPKSFSSMDSFLPHASHPSVNPHECSICEQSPEPVTGLDRPLTGAAAGCLAGGGDDLSDSGALLARPDPEIEALQLEISALEARIADLSARRVEMEQLVQHFEYCQYQALGNRLLENLRLRHEYLRLKARRSGRKEDLEAAQALAAELDSYQRVREEGLQNPRALAEDEQDELKRLYRLAVMRCHPDRVADEEKSAAHEVFLRLQAAYRQNDLEALRLLHRQFTERDSLDGQAPAVTDKGRLLQVISNLHGLAADLILAIQTMQLNDRYRRAVWRDHWEDYFVAVREVLEAESCNLKRQIRSFSTA